ncbi:hypothetical protein ACNQFZ_21190 [Schinkia sp. CFF1]
MNYIIKALVTGIVIAIAAYFLDELGVENKFYCFSVYFISMLLIFKILTIIENNKSKRDSIKRFT